MHLPEKGLFWSLNTANIRPTHFWFNSFRGTVAREREPNLWWLFMHTQTGSMSGLLAEAGGLFQSLQPEAAHLALFSGNFPNSLFYPQVPSCWGLEWPGLNKALASPCLSVSWWWWWGGMVPAHQFPFLCLHLPVPGLGCCCLFLGQSLALHGWVQRV